MSKKWNIAHGFGTGVDVTGGSKDESRREWLKADDFIGGVTHICGTNGFLSNDCKLNTWKVSMKNRAGIVPTK